VKYIKVEWLHTDPSELVVRFSELDDDRWETRVINVFHDGRREYADAEVKHGYTMLGDVPVPELDEIARNPEFVPSEITHEEFEREWAASLASLR
jgi:hypothetical protein